MNAPQNRKVFMVRESLENIPNFETPQDFAIRWFESGDEAHWLAIQAAADKLNLITRELFAHQFGPDAKLLAQRQCYLVTRKGKPVGTSTAWFNANWDGRGPYGRVHWVAILPAYQGRGLAKSLMTVTCQRLRELGHARAYLSTATARLPAIKLYWQFGFRPLIVTPDDREIWRELEARIFPANSTPPYNH
jgi:ribosomal protein S18 acetylase RimI-like enzyme